MLTKANIDGLRGQIQTLATEVKALHVAAMSDGVFRMASVNCTPAQMTDAMEPASNLMLAFRHLEDARMRLGKAIQAMNGGTSCYDQKPEGAR
jgi:hypothetical protein